LFASPDLLALHRLDPVRYPCLLESGGGEPARARYDILFAASGESLALRTDGTLHRQGQIPGSGDRFIETLDAWWESLRANKEGTDQNLPFHGGWLVFLGYELAGEIEPRLRAAFRAAYGDTAGGELPVACALRCPGAIIHDRLLGRTAIIAEPGYDELARRMADDLRQAAEPSGDEGVPIRVACIAEDDGARFTSGVERVRNHITEGDVFQVNLSREWRLTLADEVSDADIFARLRRCNPGPFSGLARLGGATLLSSSPERLFSVRSGTVETRPIAGTHPRGANLEEDRRQIEALLSHPKERAEHIMLIDLERNDLGRVCVPGSVAVDELMTVETYAHVHHIVSNVGGQLREDITPGQVIRALFPGGTITGCPKVRCMEIIAALERSPRGAYTGALGYLDRSGDMDFNILIRTMVRTDSEISLRAGAGIVADSQPQRELEETRSKARGLLRVFTNAD
jgi:anthranilate synthase component 1